MNKIKFKIGAVQQEKLLQLNENINSKFKNLIENEKDEKQLKLLNAKWKDKLFDLKDAYILTYIKDLFPSRKLIKKNVDNLEYKWIEYQTLVDYLPLLGINNQKVISRKFQKFEEFGLIKRHTHRIFNKTTRTFTGSFTFIYLCDDFYNLFEVSKLEDNEHELYEKASKMGLNPDGTEKFPLTGYSKVPSIDGTEKFPLNTLLLSSNTCNMSISKIDKKENLGINKKGFPVKDKWEKFLIENLDGIDYQIEIQKAIAKLEKNHPESYIQKYLIETYTNGLTNKLSLKIIAGVIAKGDVISKNQPKPKKTNITKSENIVNVSPDIKNKNIEKTESYIKIQSEEKEKLNNQKSNIILTPELEKKAIELLKNNGISINNLPKSKSTYENTLKYALKTYA